MIPPPPSTVGAAASSSAALAKMVAQAAAERAEQARTEAARTPEQNAAARIIELRRQHGIDDNPVVPTMQEQARAEVERLGIGKDFDWDLHTARLAELADAEAARLEAVAKIDREKFLQKCKAEWGTTFSPRAVQFIRENKISLRAHLETIDPAKAADRFDLLPRFLFSPVGCTMILWGPHGRGKTILSALLGWEAFKRGLSVVRINAWDLWPSYASEVFSGKVSDAAWMSRYTKAGLLVIEEADRMHEFAADAKGESRADKMRLLLERILHARDEAMRASLLLGNFDNWDKVRETIGPKIADRMKEAGTAMELNGKNLRDKGASQ